MLQAFTKYVHYANVSLLSRQGTHKIYPVYAKITWESPRLSITGVEGPFKNGNCAGSCGQVRVQKDHLPVNGVDLEKFSQVWDRWHLNDMIAGTPKQMEFLRNKGHATHEEGGYAKDLADLTEAGLNPDNGYVYGAKWLHEDVPEDVLNFLYTLPDTTELPEAWK